MSDFTLHDESHTWTKAQNWNGRTNECVRDVSCGLPQICSSQQKTYISHWENYHHHHTDNLRIMKQFVPSSSTLCREDDELHTTAAPSVRIHLLAKAIHYTTINNEWMYNYNKYTNKYNFRFSIKSLGVFFHTWMVPALETNSREIFSERTQTPFKWVELRPPLSQTTLVTSFPSGELYGVNRNGTEAPAEIKWTRKSPLSNELTMWTLKAFGTIFFYCLLFGPLKEDGVQLI